MFQERRLACTLNEQPPRYVLTCWRCYKNKSGSSGRALNWRLETNLIYFPQQDDDSIGIFSCYDCEQWVIKHAIRMDYRTEGYQYTRDDYIKDPRSTWEPSDRMTKHFVLRAYEFEKEERKRKQKKAAASQKRRRTETAIEESAPAQIAPAPVLPAPAIPSPQRTSAPADSTASTNPNPPRDRSATAKSIVAHVSDRADNLRRIIRTLRQPLGDEPPKISPAAADALLRELDGIDAHLHTLFTQVQ